MKTSDVTKDFSIHYWQRRAEAAEAEVKRLRGMYEESETARGSSLLRAEAAERERAEWQRKHNQLIAIADAEVDRLMGCADDYWKAQKRAEFRVMQLETELRDARDGWTHDDLEWRGRIDRLENALQKVLGRFEGVETPEAHWIIEARAVLEDK